MDRSDVIPFAYGETVAVLTASTVTDPYSGEESLSWALHTAVNHDGVGVAPGGSSEPVTDGRTPIDSDFDLFFPADAAVTAQNRVVVRGLTCEVVGHPFAWMNPFTGWAPGLVVQAKVREG